MAVKLYRCKNIWIKASGHPCWRVQKALDEQGVLNAVLAIEERAGFGARPERWW